MVGNVHKSVLRKGKARTPPGEEACKAALAKSPNMLVPWYLMGAYAYQVLDETLISDGLYDKITVDLLAKWATLTHPHKDVIDHAALVTGTSSYLATAADYPARVRGAVHMILDGTHALP
jgi:hypothetical protein